VTERGPRRSRLPGELPAPASDASATVGESGGPTDRGRPEPAARDGRPRFAHASEAELARILDYYAVRWEYEPHVFPIQWNLDGAVVESFSPDFYLPDFDLYLELTTLRQRLVRKKNRKLRRLRELYPDVRIKLFYARDFRALMLKYGRLAVADDLSGALGQVVPERASAAPTVGAPASAEAPRAEAPTGEPSDRALSEARAVVSRRGGRRPAAVVAANEP